jgi:hypothetical protein
MFDHTRARVWTATNDIFNESAVCVSRNLFGAAAFPERNPDEDMDVYLWAINCKDLLGFDTEAYQLGLGGSKQWRPGEKAYEFIRPHRVIGYVKVKRLAGYPPEGCGGWKFTIAQDAKWELNPNRYSIPNQVTYINALLEAWKGTYEIPSAYDFAE